MSGSGSPPSFGEANAELDAEGADFFAILLLGGPEESLLADPPGL